MMVTRDRGMLQGQHWTRRAADPDAPSLRRVGWRLAALTVGLLAALLLALGIVIYTRTQQVLYQSLQGTLQTRARISLGPLQRFARYGVLPPLPGGVCPIRNWERDSAGAILSVAFVSAHQSLSVVCSSPAGSATLPDQTAARQTLVGHQTTPYSTQQIGNEIYLIYTEPIAVPGGAIAGIAQVGLSENQYLGTLSSLLQVLLAVSILGLLASAAISAVLARYALRPIQVAMRRQRDFVADAAHELRTPLSIMRTAAELGLADGAVAEQQAALEQTLVQNAHLTRLVDSLSLLARADSGVLTLERQPVDLAGLAAETADGIEILAEDRAVHLSVDAPAQTCVLGDTGRLRQLLLILLDNALKYTPQGGHIVVRVDCGGGRARLQVRDSGPGIDPRDLPHLFDRFYRADRARAGEGMGLGLAIGRWIAEAHGGSITATNAPDHGAMFTVTLPLAS